jgi:hypothetical protein
MFNKLSRGWALTVQSWHVLRTDKQLLILPILSTIALLLVLASFAIPLALGVDWQALAQQIEANKDKAHGADRIPMQWWYYVVLFLFYFVNYFVITFFNSALISCAINRFNGQDSSLKAGLGVAVSRLPQILAWTAVSATVGVVLKLVEERLGWLGRIVIGLVGMAWAIATFFVVPVLVVEKRGPVDAVKRSVEVLKKTWGESLATNLGIGAVTAIATLLAFVPLIASVVACVIADSAWPLVPGIAITILLIMAIALVSATLKGILLAATYQYAATGQVPSGFQPDLLQDAFKHKVKKQK